MLKPLSLNYHIVSLNLLQMEQKEPTCIRCKISADQVLELAAGKTLIIGNVILDGKTITGIHTLAKSIKEQKSINCISIKSLSK